jgi:CRP-like cAMP-binding protein
MKKVLLIEDDIILRENTAELLGLCDYEVMTASNGNVGVYKAQSFIPDIIVCDIMMPELDGYGVLRELAKNHATKFIPFIFLSAKTEHQDIRKGMNLGADDYITKPFSEEDLTSAIESRLARVAILNDERRGYQNILEKDKDEIRTINDLKNYLYDNGVLAKFNKDEIIYREGHNSNFIYLITRGVVKSYKFDEQGKQLTMALYKEDDIFGFSSFIQNIPYQETATAIKDVELARIFKNDVKHMLISNHKVALELIEVLTNDLVSIKDQLLEMAYSSVNKKTAATLLKFAEKLNRKPKDPIKISRSDLANVAGIATETLIRTMSDFKKQGLIALEGRNIKILDIQGLQTIC